MIDVQATENNLRSKKPLKFRRFGKKGRTLEFRFDPIFSKLVLIIKLVRVNALS